MAWTKIDDITATTEAECVEAIRRLLTVHLNGQSRWSITPHVDGDPDHYQGQRTLTNAIDGLPYVEYWWFDIVSASTGATLVMYPDLTYTATPGDTGTFTERSSSTWVYESSGTTLQIYQSSNGGIAAFRGYSYPVFIDPGVTHARLAEDPYWADPATGAGIEGSYRTQIWPWMRNSNNTSAEEWYFNGLPGLRNRTTTSEYNMVPALSTSSSSPTVTSNIQIDFGIPTIGSDRTSSSSTDDLTARYELMYPYLDNDIGYLRSIGMTSELRRWADGSLRILIEVNGQYMLFMSSDTSKGAMVLNFGATDPSA